MCGKPKGFTLVEIVVLIVVLSAALVGILLVFQTTVRASADPQVQKQALAVAEALLDEILLTSFDPLPGTGLPRANFDDVNDYNGYATAGGIRDIQDNLVPGLGAYNVTVAVAPVVLNDTGGVLTPVAEALRVTVTVTGPATVSIALDGYRLKYVGP